jgi:MFS superfamily sulfate permease-like transporter
LLFHVDVAGLARGAGFFLPAWRVPQWGDVWTGFLILAIPQIPLSLGNSILATRQIVEDYFPERRVTVRRISFTYSLMNLVNPFFGGVPTCHGSGGLAGHYAFGARTGGSTIIYGLFYLTLGLFFSAGFSQIIHLFPKPVLAVILLFEALVLMALVRDMVGSRSDFFIVLLVGLSAATLPYGYVAGLVVGTVLAWWWRRRSPSAGAALSRG